MSRFPHLPETFILREMIEMEAQGWQISLFPLILQEQSVVHSEAAPWMRRAKTLPFFSTEILMANYRELKNNPSRYISTFYQMLKGNVSSPNFLVRALVLFPKIVAMAARMKTEGVQHVHAHYATHPALAAWLINRLTGIPYSVTVHAHDIFVQRAMLDVKLRGASFVVGISDFNREFLAQKVGEWIKDKTFVIHCGIQPELYPYRRRNDKSSRLEIISVGSLQPYKGFSFLIEACSLLNKRSIPFRCRIIGGGEEAPRLRKIIAREGLEEMVHLLGPKSQDEVAQLLATADCYVQPSVKTPSGKMEGIPVGLMEALASLLPVVATAISGIPELVRPGETGYLVPPQNADELARVIEHVYLNPVQAARMAENGRELVLREFNLDSNVAQLSELMTQSLDHQFTLSPRHVRVM
jgi:glycosyltransferase involved in cell wall biosynthesis